MENFHCKNAGSLKINVIAPKGRSKHPDPNQKVGTLPWRIFSKTTCKVTKAIIAEVKITKSLVVYQTPAKTTNKVRGLFNILSKPVIYINT